MSIMLRLKIASLYLQYHLVSLLRAAVTEQIIFETLLPFLQKRKEYQQL
jgi:hypothetical protein